MFKKLRSKIPFLNSGSKYLPESSRWMLEKYDPKKGEYIPENDSMTIDNILTNSNIEIEEKLKTFWEYVGPNSVFRVSYAFRVASRMIPSFIFTFEKNGVEFWSIELIFSDECKKNNVDVAIGEIKARLGVCESKFEKKDLIKDALSSIKSNLARKDEENRLFGYYSFGYLEERRKYTSLPLVQLISSGINHERKDGYFYTNCQEFFWGVIDRKIEVQLIDLLEELETAIPPKSQIIPNKVIAIDSNLEINKIIKYGDIFKNTEAGDSVMKLLMDEEKIDKDHGWKDKSNGWKSSVNTLIVHLYEMNFLSQEKVPNPQRRLEISKQLFHITDISPSTFERNPSPSVRKKEFGFIKKYNINS